MLSLFHQSMCLPKSHIGIVAPANNVLVIQCVVDSEYSWYTFHMINVSGGAPICFKDANSVIVGSRDTNFNGSLVSFINARWLIQSMHIKGIHLVVFTAHHKVHWLHWIPFQTIGTHLEQNLLQGCPCLYVMKTDNMIRTAVSWQDCIKPHWLFRFCHVGLSVFGSKCFFLDSISGHKSQEDIIRGNGTIR